MASSNVFHYLMIISIANSISSISARYGQSPPKIYAYDVVGLDDYNELEISKNDFQYVRPQNSAPSRTFLNAEDRIFENSANRPENRIARYLEDNNIICESVITTGRFSQAGYEFFPSEYINKTCVYSKTDPYRVDSNGIRKPEICLHNDNDFGCQTLYEELNVLRRSVKAKDRYDVCVKATALVNGNEPKQCWEHLTQSVAVGCKCNIRFTY